MRLGRGRGSRSITRVRRCTAPSGQGFFCRKIKIVRRLVRPSRRLADTKATEQQEWRRPDPGARPNQSCRVRPSHPRLPDELVMVICVARMHCCLFCARGRRLGQPRRSNRTSGVPALPGAGRTSGKINDKLQTGNFEAHTAQFGLSVPGIYLNTTQQPDPSACHTVAHSSIRF